MATQTGNPRWPVHSRGLFEGLASSKASVEALRLIFKPQAHSPEFTIVLALRGHTTYATSMGYRRAAQLRRTQFVKGHWRRRKSGTRYFVKGHTRNGSYAPLGSTVFFLILLVAGPFTFGLTWLAGLIVLVSTQGANRNIFREMRESRERSHEANKESITRIGEYQGSPAYQAMLARHGGEAPSGFANYNEA